MKRRNFIKGILGLAAVPVVAKAATKLPYEELPPMTDEEIKEANLEWEINRDYWFTKNEGGFITSSGTRQQLMDKKPTKLILPQEHLKEAEKLLGMK